MSQPNEEYHQTEDQQHRQAASSCWFCRRPWVTGRMTLGARAGDGGTQIPVCAAGTGCRDGRIFHGPPHDVDPHWPDEPCDICIVEHRRKAAGNQTRNLPRRTTGNRSPRHR